MAVELATSTHVHETTLSDLVSIRNNEEQEAYERLQDPSWARLWAGTYRSGWAGARGNAKALTFTGGMNAERVTGADKTTATFKIIRAAALVDGISATTAQAVRGGWGYNAILLLDSFGTRSMTMNTIVFRTWTFGSSSEVVWDTSRGNTNEAGWIFKPEGAYDRESFSASETQGAFMRDSGETYVGNEFALKLSSVTSMYQNSRFFSNLTRRGEYRFNGDFGANTKLTRWLTWNISISDRYLSNPVPGRKNHDFLYTTGIGVAFSR